MQQTLRERFGVLVASHLHRRSDIQQAVDRWLDSATPPSGSDALILVKPNLNNDLCALTGNSTDLRLIATVIEALKDRGYTNLVVADGPNIGTYRKGIDILARLGVRALCAHYDVECVDLNHSKAQDVALATGPVRIARLCHEADYFIDLPKLKTHAEAGMSLALKSLIGCVVGTDKRLVHADLPANIVALNESIRPDLIIADALIAMEGNGPGDGRPRRTDTLLAGEDPFTLDLVASRLFGLDPETIPYLAIAASRGHLAEADFEAAAELDPVRRLDPAPSRGRLVRLLDSRALAPIRDATRFLHSRESFRRLLHRLGIMQDVYEAEDAAIEGIRLDRDRCTRCGRCLAFCPLGLPILDEDFEYDRTVCRRCLYCFCVCPQRAISLQGDLGYLAAHLQRYGDSMRSL